ncbi:MAG TPA: serine hydrolase [Acidimicrobiia bacterium]|nr:serine hydrolase [Acidimicrobiia bacterium]
MHRLLAALSIISVVACGPQTTDPTAPATTAPATTALATTFTTTTTLPTAALPALDVIGTSIEGRDIEAITLGSGPTRLYVIGGIHGDERPAVENSPALLEHLRASPPAGWTIRFVADANPDGTAAHGRDNAAGVDLNRNWPSEGFALGPGTGPTPLSEPETAALAADITAFAPDLIVAMHAAREGPFVEADGDGAEWAHRFASGASSVGREWQVVEDVAWATNGSLGTYFGDEGRIPVVTVESNRWDTPGGVTNELIAGMEALLADDPTRMAAICTDHAIGITCAPPTGVAHEYVQEGTRGGRHGFIVKEVGGPVLAALHADFAFYPASTLKLVHFAHALGWIADGGDPGALIITPVDGCAGTGEGPGRPLTEVLDLMMQRSDNAAANAIQAHFGLPALQETIESAGMVDTRLVHGFGCGGPGNDPSNSSTAIDFVTLLEGLIDGSVLPRSAWTEVTSRMADVTVAAGLEGSGVTVLAKEGWYGTTLTIAGIALVPGGEPLVFAAYTDGAAAVDPDFTIASLAGLLVDRHP